MGGKTMIRRLLIGVTTVFVLGASSPVTAATKTVQITRRGFVPATVQIATGDSITWRNADTTQHQVVANNGAFASPILGPGKTFTFTFRAAGTYRYRDVFKTTFRGTVRVTGPPPSVSLGVSRPIVYYGGQTTLSGQVSNKKANEMVELLHRPYPQASFAVLSSVVTGADGTFSFNTKPTILTEYQARWKRASSIVVRSEVKPLIGFRYARASRFFYVAVKAARSYSGHFVYLQRLSRFGQWIAVKKVRLNFSSAARFRAKLPHGRSRLRIFMTVNQAGPGYLASWTGIWTVVRR
jgi:plastocyanin